MTTPIIIKHNSLKNLPDTFNYLGISKDYCMETQMPTPKSKA